MSCCHSAPQSTQPSHKQIPEAQSATPSLRGPVLGVIVSFVLAGVSMAAPMIMEPGVGSALASGVPALLIVILWGRKFLTSILKLFRSADMNTLIGIGIVSAFGLSIWNVSRGAFDQVYFETAAFVAAFVLLGQLIENLIQNKMWARMRELTELLPARAHRISNGQMHDVSLAELVVGDCVRVLVGERVPVDGMILSDLGATFDESVVTGESRPVTRVKSQSALQGTLNVGQPVDLQVVRASSESLYAQLIDQVQRSLKTRPQIQKSVDRIATFFVPLVVILSIATAIVWIKLEPGTSNAFAIALSVLVIACPCAMGLATPTALFVGVLRGARRGILLKRLDAVDRVGEISLIAFDKTGTLTEGHPAVTRVKAVDNISNSEIVQWALSIEASSEHPYAVAIRNYCAQNKISPLKAKDLVITPGRGVSGVVEKDGKSYHVVLGSLVWLFEHQYDPTQVPQDLTWEAEGSHETVIWLGVDQKPLGIIMLTDKVRDGAIEMVSELSKDGFEVGMISGDCENVVREVSKVLKLKFSHFGLSPQEKASLVKRLMQPKRKMGDFEVKRVAFIGDGVNDAPAIADAHLGIAMGSGSALAQSAADVILLSNDLGQVRSTFSILGQTRSLITQNLVLSFGYNLLAIPVAAGILFPSYGILLNPMIASAAMALSSVTVLLNSIRSLRR